MILIDTCIWIDFLRGRDSSHVKLLEGLLDDGDAYLCEVTYAEICFGAKDDRLFKKYESDFSKIPLLTLPEKWHLKVARMGHQLRRSGCQPYMADLQIALTALTHKCELLTIDRDFIPFQKMFGLKLISDL